MDAKEQSPPTCPLCGGIAESGHLAAKGSVYWLQREPGFLKDIFAAPNAAFRQVGTFHLAGPTTISGVRCESCRRFILDTHSPFESL